MPFEIIRNDIARMDVDAIVCSGNRSLEQRDGVCGAVFAAAGPRLAAHCAPLRCDTGGAVVTPGFDLPARWIVHTVGPRWNGGQSGERNILRCCYRNVLAAARRAGARTVAVPLIAAGRHGYPKEEALRVAGEEIRAFLLRCPEMTVYLVVYDPAATLLGEALQKDLRRFLTDEEYAARRRDRRAGVSRFPGTNDGRLSSVLGRPAVGFRELLLYYVERSGRKWPAIYGEAMITKSVASKIMIKPGYKPSKGTALALAIALRLDLRETEALLRSFGAALSPADKGDRIVEYFLSRGNYNRFALDAALFDNGLPCLTNNV